MQAVVRAEKLTQIAFALPAGVFVGWAVGLLLDKMLHQRWIYIAGLIVGAIAGFVQVFRMVSEPDLATYDRSAAPGAGFDDKDKE